ncbi:YjgB family protein [Clostridium sp.]|uniref:YjgB family protein n=1 Tax=Clostridium sp. TaxID=1506 RepID=UPI002635FC66|nr:YjgB family protein [Clostridium sp.]
MDGNIIIFSKKFIKLLFNKKLTLVAVILLSLTIVVGCSNSNKSSQDKSENIQGKDKVSASSNVQSESGDNSGNDNESPKSEDNSKKSILNDIKIMAQEGKIINSDFQAKSSNLQEVEEKLGKADKSEWVADAKGNYSTYSKNKVVFGSNKGGRIFEIRSFDERLDQISLSMVEDFFGTPPHDVTDNGEKIIGYVSGEDFKILFVFKAPNDSNSNPKLDHYSVLYPKGTVNSMASDPGREW